MTVTTRLHPPPLRCLECGEEADEAAEGWKALLGGGYEGEPREIGIFCPDCAEREFGET